MRVQQKIQLIGTQGETIPAKIKAIGGKFTRSVLARDYIYLPDNRAFLDSFGDRFAPQLAMKGLFLRLREESDLTSGAGIRLLTVHAYQQSHNLMLDDQVRLALDTNQNSLKDAARFLEILGLDKIVEVTKKREIYQLHFDTHSMELMIDQVEGMAHTYLEIHAYIERSELEAMRESMLDVMQAMGFNLRASVSTPYYISLLEPPLSN